MNDGESYLKNEFYEPDLFDVGAGDSASVNDIDIYMNFIKKSNCKIVDIGAGTGRISIPLLVRGIHVTAIERSEPMIEKLKSKIAKLDPAIRDRFKLLVGDFSINSENEKYNYIIACDDYLTHYLCLDSLNSFFQNAFTWLEEGGILLTDTRKHDNKRLKMSSINGVKPLNTFGVTWGLSRKNVEGIVTYFWDEYDERLRVIKTTNCYHEIDAFGKVINIYYRIIEQRLHTHDEIIKAAEQNGFSLINANSRFQHDNVNDSTDGIFYSFERK